jgi:hypothetical protein
VGRLAVVPGDHSGQPKIHPGLRLAYRCATFSLSVTRLEPAAFGISASSYVTEGR